MSALERIRRFGNTSLDDMTKADIGIEGAFLLKALRTYREILVEERADLGGLGAQFRAAQEIDAEFERRMADDAA